MNTRRIAAVAKVELRAGLHNPLTWAAVVAVVGLTAAINPAALIPSGDAAIGGVRPAATAPLALAQVFAISSVLLYAFVAALLTGLSVLRDEEARVGELLFSSSLRPREYVVGKLVGAGTIFLGLGLLQLATAVLVYGFAGNASHPVWATAGNAALAALVFAAPTIWFVAGLGYAIGEWSRRALAVGALPTLLLVLTLGVAWTWNPPDLPRWLDHLLVVLDPSGVRWLRSGVLAIDRGVAFYNDAPIPFDRWLVFNRLVVLLAPLVAVVAATQHCERRVRGRSRRLDPTPRATGAPKIRRRRFISTTRLPSMVRSALAIAIGDLRESRGNPAFWAFVAAVVGLGIQASLPGLDGAGMPTAGLSGRDAVASILPVSMLQLFLLLFLVPELVLRERSVGVSALLQATPIRSNAWIMGKFAAALCVAAATCGTIVAGTVVVATIAGSTSSPVPLVATHLLLVPTWAIWTGFLLATAVVVRNRVATYAVGLAALAATIFASQRGKLSWANNWPLWSGWRWSDFGAFELDGPALLANRLLMTVTAVALVSAAAAMTERRERDWTATPLLGRLRRVPTMVLVASAAAAAVAVAISLQIAAGPDGRSAERRSQQSRQRHFATWAAFEPPELEHVRLALVLDPHAGAVAVEGSFQLRHRGPEPLPAVPFTIPDALGQVEWTVPGRALVVERQGHLDLLRFDEAIAPGGRLEVGFRYRALPRRGWSRNGGTGAEYITASAVRLGSRGTTTFPLPGFDPGLGSNRSTLLQSADPTLARWLPVIPVVRAELGRFTTDITIDAPRHLRVAATGDQVERQEQGARVHTRWVSRVAVPGWDVSAAPWQATANSTTTIAHLPRQTANVEAILATATAAREHYGTWLGLEYPWRELRVQEVPDHHLEAVSYPTTVSISESMGFSARSHLGLPPAFAVVAHEVAHQWFPHLVPIADEPGAVVVIEGLANYLMLALAEEIHGVDARSRLAGRLEAEYLSLRRVDAERPLIEASERNDQEERVAALRGALVLWILHRELGPEAMRAGLAAAAREGRNGESLDLPRLLSLLTIQAPDPSALGAMVDQWFGDTALPEIVIHQATLEAAAGGYHVRAGIANIGTGTVTAVVAVRGDDEEQRTEVRLSPGEVITFDHFVPFPPAELIIDPDVDLLQLHRHRARHTFRR